jgi:hypothetical protein
MKKQIFFGLYLFVCRVNFKPILDIKLATYYADEQGPFKDNLQISMANGYTKTFSMSKEREERKRKTLGPIHLLQAVSKGS